MALKYIISTQNGLKIALNVLGELVEVLFQKSFFYQFNKIFLLLIFVTLNLLSLKSSQAVMVATLSGHESDVIADGRNVHIIVAGYGGDMGSLTYEMAISRARSLKRDFPNDRVVIIGSTPQSDGPISEFSPTALEMEYDISVRYRSDDPLRNRMNDQTPLTGDYLAGAIINVLVAPDDRNRLREQDPGAYSLNTVRTAITSGQVDLSGRIASLDFMTHSSPVDGIYLHDANLSYRPVTNSDQVLTQVMRERGFEVTEQGTYNILDRDLAIRSLASKELTLNSLNQIVDYNGQPANLEFSFTNSQGQRLTYNLDPSGGIYQVQNLDGSQRLLRAESANLAMLNGLFTPDAYVNVSGCSGAYGLTEDLSKVLGVPVNGAATGSLVEVMDQNGDFFYNYPASNPYGDGELSESLFASNGHELAAREDRPVMGLRVDQRLYYGYWGDLRAAGTNFVTTSCHIRSSEPQRTEDRTRCEMGMARSMEDAMTATNVALGQNLSFSDFTNVLIERMCPGGFSDRGFVSESEREVTELTALRQSCAEAVRSMGFLHQTCAQGNSQYFSNLFRGEIASGQSSECLSEAQDFVDRHRFFVPLVDRLGETLFCSLETGCEVELMGCNVTDQEERQCLEVNQDRLSQQFRQCMMSNRCQINPSLTIASNTNNPTFMKYIENYMNGYVHLQRYRQGQLIFTTQPPAPAPTEERQRYNQRMGQRDQGLSIEEIQDGTY